MKEYTELEKELWDMFQQHTDFELPEPVQSNKRDIIDALKAGYNLAVRHCEQSVADNTAN